MSRADAFAGSRRVPHLAALVLISFGVAGCSADMSSRLSNPFNYQGDATGTVPQQAAPQAQIERRELPQYSRPAYQAPAVSAPQSYPVSSGGVSGGGRGLASYTPQPAVVPPAPVMAPAHPKLETTASVAPRSVAAARPAGNTRII